MKTKLTLLALLCFTLISAQNFNEVQLPKPEFLNPLFIGPLIKSTIHYGAKPPNYNGKVIVFNHGYIDLNQGQFLFDNSFYKNTYEEGYQAVFVATTRGKGLWVNGELLSEALNIITDKYNVPKVSLVVHSNGGKAAEAAMFHYGNKDKVSKVFALGTPFWGTYLADISQLPLLNWAWSLTGLNEGARTSTTYYCRDVVRPYFDNHQDNQPDKFIVLGASGFYKGSTIAAPAFLLTGAVLLPIQGANDGVAPYSSTLRPEATYVFKKNDPRAIFDHLDVGLGQFSWPYIKSYIQNKSKKEETSNILESNKHHITSSNFYIIHSENDYSKLVLDKNTDQATVEILHEDPSKPFKLTQNDKILNQDILSDGHRTVIEVSKSNLQLESDSKFVAFVRPKNGITMFLENKQINYYPQIRIHFDSKQKSIPLDTSITGIITKISEIDGTNSSNESQVIHFSKGSDGFYFDTSELGNGVYSLLVNAESKGIFKRSLITGFVIGNIYKEIKSSNKLTKNSISKNKITIYPSLVKDHARLTLTSTITSKTSAQIYTLNGRKIKSFEMLLSDNNTADISEHLASLQRGIYLLEIPHLGSVKFVKQ